MAKHRLFDGRRNGEVRFAMNKFGEFKYVLVFPRANIRTGGNFIILEPANETPAARDGSRSNTSSHKIT